jgi:hypothetical protein
MLVQHDTLLDWHLDTAGPLADHPRMRKSPNGAPKRGRTSASCDCIMYRRRRANAGSRMRLAEEDFGLDPSPDEGKWSGRPGHLFKQTAKTRDTCSSRDTPPIFSELVSDLFVQ